MKISFNKSHEACHATKENQVEKKTSITFALLLSVCAPHIHTSLTAVVLPQRKLHFHPLRAHWNQISKRRDFKENTYIFVHLILVIYKSNKLKCICKTLCFKRMLVFRVGFFCRLCCCFNSYNRISVAQTKRISFFFRWKSFIWKVFSFGWNEIKKKKTF